VFAVDVLPHFDFAPGRTALLRALKGHVVAKGMLIGMYERE
jgi:hypothetical protein